ncbi:Quinate/shikimate 5-dehydrogenase I delta [Candidatus Paraburkholderia calva]|nr:Quinate/shikimate 5-dehydrogenase I delta [Candidatus Paraburkholderia calva]
MPCAVTLRTFFFAAQHWLHCRADFLRASRMISKTSYLIGLIDSSIAGSLTPAMHEEEGRILGLNYVYRRIDLQALNLEPSALPNLLSAAERIGYDGLNITYPCKQSVIPLLDDLDADARALGAVNTVVLKEGKRIGYNTDWSGFARAFQRGLPGVPMERVVQLGAGGAGAAVAHAALTMGARALTLFDSADAHAASLASELAARFPDRMVTSSGDLRDTLASASGLIHATPTGIAKLPGLPLPAEYLHKELWVAEIVYFPLETELLKTAKALGCRTVSGGMAVCQAVDALRIFTGREPDAERMFEHFQRLLER